MTALPVLDAHQHFWDLRAHQYPWLSSPARIPFRYGDYGAICRDYLPADYRADTAGYEVVGTVHVEAEIAHDKAVAETGWLEDLATREGLPSACVVQARLDRAEVDALLAAHAGHAVARGVRHKPTAAAAPDRVERALPGAMDDPAWRRGYALLRRHGFSFDLQAPWWHAGQAAALAADFPDTLLIIDHAFLPADRSAEGLAGWRRALELLACQPNAALKISGLGVAGRPWPAAENAALIRDAVSIMGWQRCLFASNFPVDSLVASFGQVLHAFLGAIADRPEHQRRALLHDNAVRCYRLDAATRANPPRETLGGRHADQPGDYALASPTTA